MIKTLCVRRKHPLLAWRCLFLCLILIVTLSWPLVASAQEGKDPAASPEAPASLGPFSGGAGVVSGQVINGATGSAPPEGLQVQLRAFGMDAAFLDAITTTTTADGTFRFEGIDPTIPVQLEPLVVYQDVPYFGDLETTIVLSPEQPEIDVMISIYETTQDDSAIRIERMHIVFEFFMGYVQVVEIYILSNDGDQPYVGTAEGGTLRLTVPEGAQRFEPGGDPSRYLALPDGIADTLPILPGEGTAESVVMYELAYDGQLELSRPMPYDTRQAIVMLSDARVEVSGERLASGGPFQMQDRAMQVYLADDLLAGDRLTMRLSGEPQAQAPSAPAGAMPGAASETDETQNIIAGVVALAGSLAFAYLYWQGHLRLKTQNRQPALLQAIADLDDAYKAGSLEEKPYRSRRANLKQELIELIEAEE